MAIFGDLGGYVFENFRDMAGATPCRPVNDCKMNDLEWPWVIISWQNAFSGQRFLNQSVWMSEIVQPLRLCGVLCSARSDNQPR